MIAWSIASNQLLFTKLISVDSYLVNLN